tara:strand:- start:373 stop:564 length:192 start_codon:yes stop_codon:yes gene_type:complete
MIRDLGSRQGCSGSKSKHEHENNTGRWLSLVLDELFTSRGEMATTGERVHVMKLPDYRLVLGQ